MSFFTPNEPEGFFVSATPLIGQNFYPELIKNIETAAAFIYSVQYQWKWNVHERFSKIQCLGAAITKARARGVEVRVILHKESPGKNISKINSVSGDFLARAGCAVKQLQPAGLLHTKLWIIDGRVCFIGSHNISTRSLTINEEVSVKIENEGFAKHMKNYFANLWNI